jgi:hypothetical protein
VEATIARPLLLMAPRHALPGLETAQAQHL